ncbi:MAG: ATP-binding cassette domain-containing protein [Desulfurococcaceae archaeon]
MSDEYIVLKEISKKFAGGVVALDKVTISIRTGEVLALLGENGAGKSTLVKILYGLYSADEGSIYINGRRVDISNPSEAIRHGIVMVSQHPQLIDALSVAENLALGLRTFSVLTSIKRISNFILEKSREFGVRVDPWEKAWRLTYTQKQLVEMLRAMLLNARVILLDEALTYLPLEEKKKFYKFIKEFAEKGGSAVIITHKIPEALHVADRIAILRRGKLVGIIEGGRARIEDVRKMMFGESAVEITYERLPASQPRERSVIETQDLWVTGDFGEDAVRGVNLRVREGEVVGIAGIVGNGQRELTQALIGLRKVSRGRIFIGEIDVTNRGVHVVREMGVGYIPDSPLAFGISIDNSMAENIAALYQRKSMLINWSKIREMASSLIEAYKIMIPDANSLIKVLSGGNIMKAVVSKEINYCKIALIAHNPTRALDEVSAAMVRKSIKERAINDGVAVLMVSEDLDEIYQVSDSIYVMNSGKLYGPFPPDEAERSKVEHLMVI